MLYRKLIILFLIYIPSAYGQLSEFMQAGYTSVKINVQGNAPEVLIPPKAHYSNPLLFDIPVDFERADDSTFLLSFYTYGPSPIYFVFENEYIHTILLPGKQATIHAKFSDTNTFALTYNGPYSNIFNASKIFASKLQESFEQTMISNVVEEKLNDPIYYRNFVNDRIDTIIEGLTLDIVDKEIRQYIGQNLQGLNKLFSLVSNNFKSTLYQHNLRMGKDSLEAEKMIPLLTNEYFYPILEEASDIRNVSVSSYQKLLSEFITDTSLNLPRVEREGIPVFLDSLSELSRKWKSAPTDYYKELMVGKGFSEFINAGGILSAKHRSEILDFYKGQPIADYLIYRNEQNEYSLRGMIGQYYLPFGENDENVIQSILTKYKGKVVVMDFWATWCGPCLEAHQKMVTVKQNYASRSDVVFLYMTDQSSDYVRWTEYIKTLGGEHYYLYKHQFTEISNHYGFNYLPTYLVFDKGGTLFTMQTGIENLKEKAFDWIEKALEN